MPSADAVSRWMRAMAAISAGLRLYDPATETYAEAVLHDGQHNGQDVDAYDTAALVHLADYKA
ncbi:MAG TPA: hypothetical protein VFV73_37965 [Streptosporangiaceae bacterium]|nr:hypothetical protein [Streptosporangiaceae bacterium]